MSLSAVTGGHDSEIQQGHIVTQQSLLHARTLYLVGAVDDGGAGGLSDAVHVGLAQPPEGRDARLDEEVLREVAHALLRDHQVWPVRHHLR
jgi:hypothetical protein